MCPFQVPLKNLKNQRQRSFRWLDAASYLPAVCYKDICREPEPRGHLFFWFKLEITDTSPHTHLQVFDFRNESLTALWNFAKAKNYIVMVRLKFSVSLRSMKTTTKLSYQKDILNWENFVRSYRVVKIICELKYPAFKRSFQ